MNSTSAIYGRLLSDPSVAAALDVIAGTPAIFDDAAPDDLVFTDRAVVIIAPPTSDRDASTLSEVIREVTQDVRIYAKRSGSNADLDALGRLTRDLFHLHPSDLTVDGGRCTIATATGPVAAPTTDPSLVGRRVTLRLQLRKD